MKCAKVECVHSIHALSYYAQSFDDTLCDERRSMRIIPFSSLSICVCLYVCEGTLSVIVAAVVIVTTVVFK